MDENVFNVVKLVDIVSHFLAGVVNEFLNKSVSAKGNTQANISFSREGCESDRVLDGCEACIILNKSLTKIARWHGSLPASLVTVVTLQPQGLGFRV